MRETPALVLPCCGWDCDCAPRHYLDHLRIQALEAALDYMAHAVHTATGKLPVGGVEQDASAGASPAAVVPRGANP